MARIGLERMKRPLTNRLTAPLVRFLLQLSLAQHFTLHFTSHPAFLLVWQKGKRPPSFSECVQSASVRQDLVKNFPFSEFFRNSPFAATHLVCFFVASQVISFVLFPHSAQEFLLEHVWHFRAHPVQRRVYPFSKFLSHTVNPKYITPRISHHYQAIAGNAHDSPSAPLSCCLLQPCAWE